MEILEENICALDCDCGWHITIGGTKDVDLKKIKEFVMGTYQVLEDTRCIDNPRIQVVDTCTCGTDCAKRLCATQQKRIKKAKEWREMMNKRKGKPTKE